MPTDEMDQLRERAELAERLALVAMEMVLTLGADSGRCFDLRSYADSISVDVEDVGERRGRQALSATLHRIAASLG